MGEHGAGKLAEAARADDRRALVEMMSETQRDVWRLCAHLAGREAADDLVQEVYLRAWRSLRAGRVIRTDLRAWLLGIARHVAVDEVRSITRRRRLLARLQPPASASTGGTDQVHVDDLLAGLSPDRRTAFVLTQVLGLSYEDAAAVCGCRVGTIRSRVYRARADLALAVAPPGPDAVLEVPRRLAWEP